MVHFYEGKFYYLLASLIDYLFGVPSFRLRHALSMFSLYLIIPFLKEDYLTNFFKNQKQYLFNGEKYTIQKSIK